jgi:uncharacterized protein (DUF302 family)
MSDHGSWKQLQSTYDEALALLPGALAAEGFGIITQIDMKETFKNKLGIDFRRYKILGACNPKLASEALAHDPRLGVLLPCNVVLYETDEGKAVLGAIDPMSSLGASDPGLVPLAELVRGKLERTLAAVP